MDATVFMVNYELQEVHDLLNKAMLSDRNQKDKV